MSFSRARLFLQVDGCNVYCKGSEVSSKLIIGRCGSVCTLRLARVEQGQRINYKVALVRELRASTDPCFRISQSDTRTTTSQVFLDCLRMPDPGGCGAGGSHVPLDTVADSFAEAGGSSCEVDVPAVSNLGGMGGAEKRKVFFQGVWYTEEQVRGMESSAMTLKKKIAQMERGAGDDEDVFGPDVSELVGSVDGMLSASERGASEKRFVAAVGEADGNDPSVRFPEGKGCDESEKMEKDPACRECRIPPPLSRSSSGVSLLDESCMLFCLHTV